MPPSLEHLVDRQVGNGLSRITASEAVYDTEGWGRLPRVLNFAKPNTAFQASLRAALARCADGLACEAWNARMLGYKGPTRSLPALGHGFRPRTNAPPGLRTVA